MGLGIFLMRLFSIKRTKKKTISEQELPDINKDIEKAAAYDRAKRLLAERDNKLLKQKHEKDKVGIDLAKQLYLQREEKVQEPFKNAFSLRKLFTRALIGKVRVLSHNGKKEFGILLDIGVLQNGLFSIQVQDKNRKNAFRITGRDIRSIIKDPGGLNNHIKNKILHINLDEQGRYVPNYMTKEVPDIVMYPDENGKYKVNLSKYDSRPFIDILIEKESQINEMHGDMADLERSNRQIVQESNISKLNSKINKEAYKTTTADLADSIKNLTEEGKSYKQMQKENAVTENIAKLTRSMFDTERDVKDSIHAKLAEQSGKTTQERAKEEITEDIGILADLKNTIPVPDINLPQPVEEPK